MRNKKEFLAAVKRSKTSPGKSKESNLAQTARLIAAVEQVTELRSRIGSGDSSLERTLLELHEETGLNILEIGNLPAREFQRILKAAIRKRDSRNWIPVATEHLRNERTRLSRMAKTPNESGLRRIEHGQYQVRRDKLGLLIKPSALNLYRN